MTALVVDPDWFHIREVSPGLFSLCEPGHANAFLVCGKAQAALIDTGMGFCSIRAAVRRGTPLPVIVLNTHWHFDHIGSNREFDRVCVSKAEREFVALPLSNRLLNRLYLDSCTGQGISFPRQFKPEDYEIANPLPGQALCQGDRVALGGRTLTVLETPGHTHGSLSFLDDAAGALICGDLLYDGTLYAHFTDSDLPAYRESLSRLETLMSEISMICAGHNEPVVSPEIIRRAGNLIQLAAEGRTRPEIIYDWGTPVLRHVYRGLGLLTPEAGSGGIDLLA